MTLGCGATVARQVLTLKIEVRILAAEIYASLRPKFNRVILASQAPNPSERRRLAVDFINKGASLKRNSVAPSL